MTSKQDTVNRIINELSSDADGNKRNPTIDEVKIKAFDAGVTETELLNMLKGMAIIK